MLDARCSMLDGCGTELRASSIEHRRARSAQCRCRHDLDQLLADAELIRGKRFLQVRQRPGTERAEGLLHEILEQLLDERGVRLLAPGQEAGESADAIELYGAARTGLVTPRGNDRPAVLLDPV